MGIMEIVLLLAGGIVFILSFVVPAKKEEDYEETRGLAKDEIRSMVSEELEAVRGHVDDVVEEAVTYSMEKTERSLERLSNEKIMAVNEYSDTVLSEIHKNHEEVMFLYDMLNDKHVNLKNTVSEVNKTVKEAEETKREAEEVVNTFQRLAPQVSKPSVVPIELIQPQISAFVQPVEQQSELAAHSARPAKPQPPLQSAQPIQSAEPQQFATLVQSAQPIQSAEPQQFVSSIQSAQPTQSAEAQQFVPPIQSAQPMQSAEPQQFVPLEQSAPFVQLAQPVQTRREAQPLSKLLEITEPEPVTFRGASLPTGTISFTQETDERGRNYNDVILDLYKKGKSKVAIAKELNLGVGEVNLVIGLYKNM